MPGAILTEMSATTEPSAHAWPHSQVLLPRQKEAERGCGKGRCSSRTEEMSWRPFNSTQFVQIGPALPEDQNHQSLYDLCYIYSIGLRCQFKSLSLVYMSWHNSVVRAMRSCPRLPRRYWTWFATCSFLISESFSSNILAVWGHVIADDFLWFAVGPFAQTGLTWTYLLGLRGYPWDHGISLQFSCWQARTWSRTVACSSSFLF